MTARIYQADAAAALCRIPRGSITLVVTDPPYRAGADWGDQVYRKGLGYRQLAWSTITAHLRLARARLRQGGGHHVGRQ